MNGTCPQCHKEQNMGGTGICKRGFPGIPHEAQLSITIIACATTGL